MYRRHAEFARYLVVTTLIAIAALVPAAASAQGDSDTTTLQVGAVLCQDADCIDHSNLYPGLTITASDSATGETLATCTTSAAEPHTCLLEMPAGANWTLDWDQTPDGYAWRGDLYPVADGPFGSATLIPFVPAQATEPTVAPDTPIVIEEPGHITVQAALCTDTSCAAFAELLDGFALSAIDPDTGEVFSSCTTGNAQQGLDHQCLLDVPHDGGFDLTWDDAQVPDGYQYFGEPIVTGTPRVTTIAFVPASGQAAAPAETHVTALPDTGAGPDANAAIPWAAILLATAGALLTALATTRLRPAPR